jgi:phosphoglucosamine mutase
VKILLDCSNGATYSIAPEVFDELGAHIKVIGGEPDGKNINVGVGSENPHTAMSYENFDFKIIFDGDGDRVLIGDSKNLYDGDQIISLLARFMMKEGKLRWGIVGTILSNMALEKFARENNINFTRVDVGDRNVAYKMREVGSNLGGEESGHIILYDFLPTGDGILVALQVLKYVISSGVEMNKLVIEKFHQAKGKLKIKEKIPLDSPVFGGVEKIKKEIQSLGGRAVVRYSGTEPVIRIMVEHEDKEISEKFKSYIEEELKKVFGDK